MKTAAGPPKGNLRPLSASLILLMKNHLRYMQQSFDIISSQDYQGPVEIIYIDSGSTDGTIEFMRERGVEPHCIPSEEFHHARTRNLAGALANHEILVLLSADAIPTDGQWLRTLLAPFADHKVAAVYGKQIAPQGTGPLRTRGLEYLYPDRREVRDLTHDDKVPMSFIRFSNANAAVRTEVWRRFKFPETALVAEDHWICYKALKEDMKVVYEPRAAVVHGHERSIWGEFQFAVDNAISLKRMGVFDDPNLGSEFKYGINRVRSDWQYFTSKRMYGCAVKSLIISVVKWVGVQLGKLEVYLPRWLLKHISEVHKKLPVS